MLPGIKVLHQNIDPFPLDHIGPAQLRRQGVHQRRDVTSSGPVPAFVRSSPAVLRPRCEQLARVLKKTSSFYYQYDWHASHYVKVMLDGLCRGELSNEVVWRRT